MGKTVIFPPSRIYNFQKCYHSCHSYFKIITLTAQTNVSGRPNTRQAKRASKSDHGQEQLNRFDINHNKHWPLEGTRIWCCTFPPPHPQKNKQEKYKCLECNMGLCAIPCFQGVTQNCISEDQLTLTWKRGAHRYTYILLL